MRPGRTPPSTSPRKWKNGEHHGFASLVGLELNLGQGAMQKARGAKPNTLLCWSHKLGTILGKLGEIKKAIQPEEDGKKSLMLQWITYVKKGRASPVVVLPNVLAGSKEQSWSDQPSPGPKNSCHHLLETHCGFSSSPHCLQREADTGTWHGVSSFLLDSSFISPSS